METNTTTVEKQPAVAATVVATSTTTEIDAEARIAQLEAEKTRIATERDNYRTGMLKAKGKLPADDPELDLTGDDRLRAIAREELANSELARIAEEQDTIIKATLKENKELKLAQMNKTTVPATVGAHSESQTVSTDPIIPADQMAYFKSKNWTDKDIELYKKNLMKNGGR